MDKLSALQSYVHAVQTGSLSGAARLRRISQPAISQQLASLEAQYDNRLLYRSRNGVRMTEAGEIVYKHAAIILDEHKVLLTELEKLSGKVEGELSITANLGLSQHLMADVIIQLAKQHPKLKVVLRADDRLLDLEKEKIDLALRSGNLGTGNGVARKIATLNEVLVATPKYLDSVGRPTRPDQLINLDYIQYRANADQKTTPLVCGSQSLQVPVNIGLTAQHPSLIMQALNSNLGFAKIPTFAIKQAVSSGELEIVLPKWRVPPTDLFIVFPARETLSPRINATLKVLFDHLEKTLEANLAASARQMLNA